MFEMAMMDQYMWKFLAVEFPKLTTDDANKFHSNKKIHYQIDHI